ncbi:MAG: hypothetical protein U0872_06705 [Planctomycetaceae bacterium]
MNISQLLRSGLLMGLLAGCSQSMPGDSSISNVETQPEPEWARDVSPTSAAAVSIESQPFPDVDEVAATAENSAEIKPIPEDGN